MKIRNNLFGIALATLLMTGCQDKIHISENSEQIDALDGYVKVSINMSSAIGTRAIGYENGLADEYRVNNAIIAFFTGDKNGTETDATFTKAYNMDLNMNNNAITGQITSTSDAYIIKAPAITNDKQLYALVIINPNSVVTLGADEESMTINGSAITSSSKLSDFQRKLSGNDISTTAFTNAAGLTGKSFTMTNTPLSDKSGQNLTDANATTLVPVTVYKTREEAAIASSTQIYVERVVAKVSATIDVSIKDNVVTPEEDGIVVKVEDNSQYAGDRVELTGWALNVTNKSTRLVRDVSGFSTWIGYTGAGVVASRFVEDSPVRTGIGKYRIDWAVDGNYDNALEAYSTADFAIYTVAHAPIWTTAWEATTTTPNANVAYCLENTFTVNDITKDRTTSLLIKAVYRRAADAAGIKDFFAVGTTGTLLSEDEFKAHLQNNVGILAGTEITISETAQGGYYNEENGKPMSDLISATKDGIAVVGLDRYISDLGTVKFYKNGTTYYHTSPIRHFGDSEAGWDYGETYNDAKHLGRYGVVRNTWYQLNINKISGPGEPEPNNRQEAYINVQTNIRAWAIRQNNVDL